MDSIRYAIFGFLEPRIFKSCRKTPKSGIQGYHHLPLRPPSKDQLKKIDRDPDFGYLANLNGLPKDSQQWLHAVVAMGGFRANFSIPIPKPLLMGSQSEALIPSYYE